ncbi:MAG: hypothetical protein HYR60_08635 [Acidobacteria bacterium]|nr:hypothetical protein [Acidobacteriota bacterium]
MGEWTRVTSLTSYRGRLFAGIGSCTSSLEDAPADIRGQVFSMQAGHCCSYDRDIGPGWRPHGGHPPGRKSGAIRGRKAAIPVDRRAHDTSNTEPLRIGNGEIGTFSGKVGEVRLYRGAIETVPP